MTIYRRKGLENVKWSNLRLDKGSIAEEISKIKQQPGKDMVIYGNEEEEDGNGQKAKPVAVNIR